MTKRIMKYTIICFTVATLTFLSCKEVLFHREERTREIHLGDFHAVSISGIYNIVLIQDSANMLEISGTNSINSIDAIIKNDTLFISDHKKMSFNPYKDMLALHFSNLKYIVTYDPVNISNSGTIKADQFSYEALGEIVEARMTLDCEYFYFVDSGNTLGFFYFSGNTGSCLLWNRYGSTIFADSLYCRDAEVINGSVGDIFVNVSDNIRASIIGPGNIYYHGTPFIEIAVKKGTGSIIPLH